MIPAPATNTRAAKANLLNHRMRYSKVGTWPAITRNMIMALIDLLKDLGSNADLAEQYQKDPQSVMAQYQLSREEQAAMTACDMDKLAELAGTEKLQQITTIITCGEG